MKKYIYTKSDSMVENLPLFVVKNCRSYSSHRREQEYCVDAVKWRSITASHLFQQWMLLYVLPLFIYYISSNDSHNWQKCIYVENVLFIFQCSGPEKKIISHLWVQICLIVPFSISQRIFRGLSPRFLSV